MKRAIYAGSFDPISYGHLSIIKTALSMVENLTIALGVHAEKNCLFSQAERLALIQGALASEFPADLGRINIVSFENLLVDVAKKLDIVWLIRGVRDSMDFEYERRMLDINAHLSQGSIQTILLPAQAAYRAVSSTIVKEIARLKGDLEALVPVNVREALEHKFR